ncbi:MAG: hypothetical protein DHS20C12_09710 [Pseudohongiella sp.]|nr:MAG: hypothetical protein DHS20C12_09710 [Pseudohongiella sp.]
MKKTVGAIVLAAGFSSRFGSSKLLAQLTNGKTVFQQTVERIAEAFPARIVVTRPEMLAALQNVADGTPLLGFDHAELGMGASLAFAVEQIQDWDGCVVCLGDMPFIEVSSYRDIAEHLTANTIVIPTFDAQPGNPVGFGKDFFSELATLSGDSGGRKLTRLHPDAVRELQLTDPGIRQDIDTLEELAQYQDS